MNKRRFIVVIVIVLALICGFWIGADLTAKHAINHINEVSEMLNKETQLLNDTKNELLSTKEKLSIEEERLHNAQSNLDLIKSELDMANQIIADLKGSTYELVYVGDYKLTHYCTEKISHICGTGAGITATGTQVAAGRTIAVDPTVIPYGTKVYIEGYGYRIAEDCGGAVKGKHIDVAVETHSQALSMGTTTGGVWILVNKGS